MEKLSQVSQDALQEALNDVMTGKAAKRLMIALAYKDGVSVTILSKRYDIPQSTVYYWLNRFEEMPIEEAIQDEPRPGRPPALTQDEQEQLYADLQESPQIFEYDEEYWSSEMIQQHILNRYGVEYSEGHIRRLLRSADLESPYL